MVGRGDVGDGGGEGMWEIVGRGDVGDGAGEGMWEMVQERECGRCLAGGPCLLCFWFSQSSSRFLPNSVLVVVLGKL